MKIAIWSYANLGRVYGIVWTLARFLQMKGHSVEVVYLGDRDGAPAELTDVSIRCVASARRRGLLRALTFWRAIALRRKESDVVVLVGTRSALFSWPFWKLGRRRSAVFAYELDGDGRMELLANRIARSATHLIEVNPQRARLRTAVARQPDLVVRNVPDRITTEQICRLRSIERKPRFGKIMYGGLIAHYQGIDLLVEGFARSNARELELIGKPEDPAYLDRLLAIPLPSGKTLTITDGMPRQALLERLWGEASVLACLYPYSGIAGRMNRLNTLYAEPTKYYEYLLLGIPFITTSHPSLPQNLDGVFLVEESQDAVAGGLNAAMACSQSFDGRPFNRSASLPVYEAELDRFADLMNRPATTLSR